MTEQDSPKVVIIEDSKSWQEMTRRLLEDMGVSVVAIVDNMLQATEEIIPQLEALGVQFVLLDGNLDPNESSGAEGRALAAQIREQAPSVKIVGFSGNTQDYIDIPLGKSKFSEEGLRKAVLGE